MAKPSPRSPLAEMQVLMARAVMRPLTSGEGMQAQWSDGSSTADLASSFVKPNDRLSSFERLQIYNQQYWWRLHGSFAEDYRGVRAVLGERRFQKLADAYLEQCGSMSWTLRDLGKGLEGFLRERPELTAPHTDLALDMARVEWARVIAFDGAELPPLSATELMGATSALLQLGLQPYISLLELHHPIDELLRKLKRAASVEVGAASNAVSLARPRARRRLAAPRSDEPIYLAVHRVDLSVYYKRLDPAAFRLLTALRTGTTLDEACSDAFDPTDPTEICMAKLQGWFSDWMKFGWFTRASSLKRRRQSSVTVCASPTGPARHAAPAVLPRELR